MTHALIGAGLAALALANPAHADTRTIRYADLDLSTAHGRAALDARVRNAARQVCEISTDTVPLAQRTAAAACYADAMASARHQFASIEAHRTTNTDRLR